MIQELIKTAFENGINMIDTAEAYAKGNSEVELYAYSVTTAVFRS